MRLWKRICKDLQGFVGIHEDLQDFGRGFLRIPESLGEDLQGFMRICMTLGEECGDL